jgi:hypothetical protein
MTSLGLLLIQRTCLIIASDRESNTSSSLKLTPYLLELVVDVMLVPTHSLQAGNVSNTLFNSVDLSPQFPPDIKVSSLLLTHSCPFYGG